MKGGTGAGSTKMIYLVLDSSYSVIGEELSFEQDHVASRLLNSIADDAILGTSARICVVQFSDSCEVRVPLSRLSDLSSFFKEAGGPGTSYSSLFRVLRSQIEADIAEVSEGRGSIARPIVLLLSDGKPGDDWGDAYDSLMQYDRATQTGFVAFPYLLPVAIGPDPDMYLLNTLACPHNLLAIHGKEDAAIVDAVAVLSDLILGGRDGTVG